MSELFLLPLHVVERVGSGVLSMGQPLAESLSRGEGLLTLVVILMGDFFITILVGGYTSPRASPTPLHYMVRGLCELVILAPSPHRGEGWGEV